MKPAALFALCIGFVFLEGAQPDQFDGISGCRATKLDLIFVLDGSSSEFQHDFSYVRIWIQNLTSHFDISPHTTRVAVIQSGDPPYNGFGFDDFGSTNNLLGAVNNIQFGGGSGTTKDVLRYVADHVVSYARPDASVIVLILSDGRIQERNHVHRAARQLHDMGVTTFAIGAGENMARSQNVEYLKAIASDPMKEHLFVVQELRNIGTLERSIISEVCTHTVQECPTASHDLAFIIDGSSTIGYKNFEKIKSWMKKIVEAFDVGKDNTRIAVIQYSTNVQEEISFNDKLTKAEVLEKIGKMRLMIGDTHTGHALEYCMKVIFSDNYGSRDNIPDVVIVMTDGKAQDHKHVVAAAQLVHDAGIEVYAMGVGDNYSLEEIKDIASDPDEKHIILANSFQQIDLQRIGLIKRICEESEPGCPNTAADIVFLVDNRLAIGGDNVQNVQAWLKNAVDYLEVGQHYSRIGLVRYDTVPEVLFGLSEYSSTSQVIGAISKLLNAKNINENEFSATGIAIDYAKTALFREARTNVPRFLVVLTNGESSDNFAPAVKRAEKAGVKIFSFGVGDANMDHLRALASASNYVFHDYTFDGIRRQLGSFMSALCEVSEPACSIQEIDLQFLVDASDNITPGDFEKVKRWIRNVIRSFDIGNYTTRVGLTQYSSTIQTAFDMDTYKTRREIEHAVEMIKLTGGPSHTGIALEHVMQHSFTEKAGSRTGAAKVLVVLSDGNSEDSIIDAVNKIHAAGIRVFAVGAGSNTERAFLETLATEPILTHVTESSSYDAINTVRKQIVGEICRETKSECPEAEMDLIFLVDGSTTIGPGSFQVVKDWLVSFVEQFEIGEHNSKIGLVQYADEPRLEINLKKASDKETLVKAIVNVRHLNGTSHTGVALKYVRAQGFSDKLTRNNIPKVVIVLTNGKSNDDVIAPAQELVREGVIMYAVGVGNTYQRELRFLASSDENVLHVRNVNAIPTIQSSLVRRVCQGVQIDCRENATDIVMLIDGSYSVGRGGWDLVRAFMQNITRRFEIGPKGVRVAVVQYASHPRVEFLLKDHDDYLTLQKAIRNMKWMMGDTHTSEALRFTREQVLTEAAGARPGVSKLFVLVTDGDPQDGGDIYEAASAIRSDGWRIFAIGVGQANLSELHVLASKPEADHVFHADDFESTRKLKGRLFRMICAEHAVREDEDVTGGKPTTTGNLVEPGVDFDVTGDDVDRGRSTDFDVNDNGDTSKKTSQFDIVGPDVDRDVTGGEVKGGRSTDFDVDIIHNAEETGSKSSHFDDARVEFDIPASDHLTLEVKEPTTVHINPAFLRGRSLLPGPDSGSTTNLKQEKKRKRPKDGKDVGSRPPAPGGLVAAECPEIRTRGKEVAKGWDYLREMGVVYHKSSDEPKQNALFKRLSSGPFEYQTVKGDFGSTENHTSYRIPSGTMEFRPLSQSFVDVFRDAWSFVAVFRWSHATRDARWTLVNITDDAGNIVFSVAFDKANRALSIETIAEDAPTKIYLPSSKVKRLFDKTFHKLEISANDSQISVRIDCKTVKRDRFRLSSTAPRPLVGTWMTGPSNVIANIQEMFFKCYPFSKESCCELSAGECGKKNPLDSVPALLVNSSAKVSEMCVCPPGPQGPPGPPGRTITRAVKGKPGARGPPGKVSPPPVKKSTIRHIAQKVARALIQDEMRKMYKVILDSISEDGRMDAKLIKGVLSKYERWAVAAENRAASKTNHRKSIHDASSSDRIPDAILKEILV